MAHHKEKVRTNSTGQEIRLRRDRKANKDRLTKDKLYWPGQPRDPDPDGKKPTTTWILHTYPKVRSRRKALADTKRKGRKIFLKKEERKAFKEQLDKE